MSSSGHTARRPRSDGSSLLGTVPTRREMEMLAEYLRGGSVKEAAQRLGVGHQAAKTRLGVVYARLGVDSAIEAAGVLGWLVVPEGVAA